MPRTLVVIPARLQSTRLPGKPLADINGMPMITHVWRRAIEADVGRVVVASDSEAINEVIRAAGGEAILTRGDHASGSDRVFEALALLEGGQEFEVILNLQGDLPTLDADAARACLEPIRDPGPDIATIAVPIAREEERHDPNVVKVVGTPTPTPGRLRALYFTRATAPTGEGPLYHHVGIYAYRRRALERFVSLPPSPLERRERLEQLRALEDGMRIDVTLVDAVPLGVDTPADLDRARQLLAASRVAGVHARSQN
jgi:3-deoxy-manno-octulosonate cytidylyltransferase (CMP-KDO synthetase)